MLTWLMDEKSGESGQGMVEYGLILVLVSIVAIGALSTIGKGLTDNFGKINSELSGEEGTGGNGPGEGEPGDGEPGDGEPS